MKCTDCPFFAGKGWCKIAPEAEIEFNGAKWAFRDKPVRVIKAAGYCLTPVGA